MICTCINCHQEFKRKPNTKGLYCSNKCSVEHRFPKEKSMVERTCLECNKTFYIKKHTLNNKHIKGVGKYCSKACQIKANSGQNLTEYTCKHCGNTFLRAACQVKNINEIYCSVHCRAEGRKDQFIHTCLNCGIEFSVQRAVHESGNGKYCSKECHSESMKILEDVECTCINCGNIFLENGVRVNEGRGKYCSKECRDDYLIRNVEYVEKECEVCHTHFTVLKSKLKHWDIKHCSDECRVIAKEQWRESRQANCLYCNKVFIPRLSDIRNGGGKYCSKECVNNDHAPVKLKCLVCNADFEVPPSTYRSQNTKYCSKECSVIGKIKLVEKECEFCHQPFMARPRRLAMGMDRFCSKKCVAAHSHSVGTIVVKCKHCQKEFPGKRSLVTAGITKYCSIACKNAAPKPYGNSNKLWLGGKIGSYGPDWYRQRNAAHKRDNGECQCCHRSKKWNERGFHVHHIVKRRSFGADYKSANDLNNLITLCPKCHRAVESGKVPCPQPNQVVIQVVNEKPAWKVTTLMTNGLNYVANILNQ